MFYLLVCQSLTYAQRSARSLERKGIGAVVQKAPAETAANGCAYAVRIAARAYPQAMAVLSEAGLRPKRVFIRENDELREIIL